MGQIRQFSHHFCLNLCEKIKFSQMSQNRKKSIFCKLKNVKTYKLSWKRNHEERIAKESFSFLRNLAFFAKKSFQKLWKATIWKAKKVISYDPNFRLQSSTWPLEISKSRESLLFKTKILTSECFSMQIRTEVGSSKVLSIECSFRIHCRALFTKNLSWQSVSSGTWWEIELTFHTVWISVTSASGQCQAFFYLFKTAFLSRTSFSQALFHLYVKTRYEIQAQKTTAKITVSGCKS